VVGYDAVGAWRDDSRDQETAMSTDTFRAFMMAFLVFWSIPGFVIMFALVEWLNRH
jgi:hypothetical protein